MGNHAGGGDFTFHQNPLQGEQNGLNQVKSPHVGRFISFSEYVLVVNFSVKCPRVGTGQNTTSNAPRLPVPLCLTLTGHTPEQLHCEFSLTNNFI